MSELLSNPEHPIDWELARQVVGFDAFEAPGTSPDIYDERREIARDIKVAEGRLRDQLWRASIAGGVEISEEHAMSWRATDDPSYVEYLQKQLQPQCRMARIIQGLLAFEADKLPASQEQGVPLRRHQHSFAQDILRFTIHAARTPGTTGKSGFLEGPTGIGKTALFSKVVSRLQYFDEPDDPTRVLILVPTEKIRDQTIGAKGDRGFGKFAPHLDVGAYPNERESLHERAVTVMCNASFDSLCRNGKMPEDFPVIIVDEGDTVLGDATSENLRAYAADKLMIGLSATTEVAGRSVYDFYEHKIGQMNYRQGVRAGLLAPTRGTVLSVKPQIDPRSLPSDPVARKAAMRQARLEAYMSEAKIIIKEAVENGDGVIVRCPPGEDIGHAYDFAQELRDMLVHEDRGIVGGMRWIVAGHVGGSSKRQTKSDREVVFDGYDDGFIDVLTYVKAIGRGYDSPRAKVFINLSPTTSLAEIVQGSGRAGRLIFDADRKPREARLYDFEDPELGDKQKTCLDILGTRSGELLEHDEAEAAEPRPRRERVFTPHADITAITTEVVATMAVKHAVKSRPPTAEEVEASLELRRGETIDQGEAATILGIHLPSLKNILQQVGANPDRPIKAEDLLTILQLYPSMRINPLPETGYVSVFEVAKRIQGRGHVRSFALIAFARRRGFAPQRFRADSGVDFFWHEEDAEEVMRLYEDNM